LRILEFVAAATRPSRASFGACVGIDAELQTAGVDVVSQRFDACREELRVRLDVAIGIAFAVPAVVDDDVLIADALHAGGNHLVGG